MSNEQCQLYISYWERYGRMEEDTKALLRAPLCAILAPR